MNNLVSGLLYKNTMNNMPENEHIIEAWKEQGFLGDFTDDELAMLPDNPAGMVELSDDVLELVTGGSCPSYSCSNVSP